jgi:subtilisin family serine protease
MRFLGKEYTGKGVSIAIVDSGINKNDPRLAGVEIEGWSIQLGAMGHAMLGSEFHDEHGHGTEMAVAVHRLAPDAKLLAVKIMGDRLRTSAELMGAGIETSARNGVEIINLSMGTPNMGQALRLRECCANAVETGSVVLASAHPKGDRAYPADLPETVGVSSHKDCPIDKLFYFDPKRFPRKEWGTLSAKFLTHGYGMEPDGRRGRWRGPGIATAYLSGTAACLAEALGKEKTGEIVKTLKRLSLVPIPEMGYS